MHKAQFTAVLQFVLTMQTYAKVTVSRHCTERQYLRLISIFSACTFPSSFASFIYSVFSVFSPRRSHCSAFFFFPPWYRDSGGIPLLDIGSSLFCVLCLCHCNDCIPTSTDLCLRFLVQSCSETQYPPTSPVGGINWLRRETNHSLQHRAEVKEKIDRNLPLLSIRIPGGVHSLQFIITSTLSHDRSKASSKTIPPLNAI
jgi:hypothetical protein